MRSMVEGATASVATGIRPRHRASHHARVGEMRVTRGTMRSMGEGADTSAASVIRPLHRLRRSPSPASRVRNGRRPVLVARVIVPRPYRPEAIKELFWSSSL